MKTQPSVINAAQAAGPETKIDAPGAQEETAANRRASLSDDALRLSAARLRLRLGQADEALRELEALPRSAWQQGAALKIRIAALCILRGRVELVGRA